MDRIELPGPDVVLEEATAEDLPALIELMSDDMLGASRDGIRSEEDRQRYERAFAAIARRGAFRAVIESVRVSSSLRSHEGFKLMLGTA